MAWHPYRTCCSETLQALPSAMACAECGNPLLRCTGVDSCNQLIEPDRACPVCAPAPLLAVEPIGSMRRGDTLALPFVIANRSPLAQRSFRLVSFEKREGNGPYQPVPVPFERVETGEGKGRQIVVQAGPFESSGKYAVGLRLVVEVPCGSVTETYAYEGTVFVEIAPSNEQAIQFHVDLSGASIGQGQLINIAPFLGGRPAEEGRAAEAAIIDLQRAERHERQAGLRGLADQGNLEVPRDVELVLTGVKAPLAAGRLAALGRITVGNPIEGQPAPDLPLPVEGADGQSDAAAMARLAGPRFRLQIENDRLVLVNLIQGGVAVDGRRLARDERFALGPSNRIALLPDEVRSAEIAVTFVPGRGRVDRIEMVRTTDLRDKRPDLAEGGVFAGRYEILRKLGEGGMGQVYAVRDVQSQDEMALKLVRRDLMQSDDALKRLVDEGRRARRIRHRNVVSIYDVAVAGDQPYLTMELLEGSSLRDVLNVAKQTRRDIPVPAVMRIVAGVLEGLGEAHRQGLVHRDIKPENIFVEGDVFGSGAVETRILDFGIAKAAGPMSMATMRASGATGTPRYWAPEQQAGADVIGPEADLYSVGILLYELLLRGLPAHGALGQPSEQRRDVPAYLDKVVGKAVQQREDNRFQTAAEFAAALASAPAPEPQRKPVVDPVPPRLDPVAKPDPKPEFKPDPVFQHGGGPLGGGSSGSGTVSVVSIGPPAGNGWTGELALGGVDPSGVLRDRIARAGGAVVSELDAGRRVQFTAKRSDLKRTSMLPVTFTGEATLSPMAADRARVDVAVGFKAGSNIGFIAANVFLVFFIAYAFAAMLVGETAAEELAGGLSMFVGIGTFVAYRYTLGGLAKEIAGDVGHGRRTGG
ncbi:serine/threonine-protein kinase [Prosthecodimorpha staleyi]|uniref:Serine/threonine protein kinase n=1 Tax=Prosthecodimorpha staleyi TaxID=2840188 RepID=A0A947CZE3_9HYPH|nr:serine/threonine-protein kinase [Prosthecodimorpha staleyi]MBT9288088.1 serine/threonine protein kinase [Prosthecodimorpha staleyi]